MRSLIGICARISFKFCRKVYLSQLYPSRVFGGAAPSVPSFIGSKVILVDILVSHTCVHYNSCISARISFKFCMKVYLSQLYPPRLFGGAAPSVPSFIGSKVILVDILVSHSCARSKRCISLRISLKFCMVMYHDKLYPPMFFGVAAPSVPSFIGSKVSFG